MSEKDADDNFHPTENGNDSDLAQALPQEEDNLEALLDSQCKEKENDLDLFSPANESTSRKEENPFSFKKFLNQDLSSQKNKGARKKVFTMPPGSTSSNKLDLSNHSLNRNSLDLNSRIISATEKSSILPDFVQDHLVVEQCYLSRNSAVDIDNLNLQNFPDLNLDHKNVHFMLQNDNEAKQSQLPNQFSPNLPDFTLGGSNFQSGMQGNSHSERLPDFTLHGRTGDSDVNTASRRNNSNNSNHIGRGEQRVQLSSSPSVPLDLPSYENNESNQNLFIPFDLTAPAEENNGSCRGRNSNETVSKSLPDFLSDGPIKKELDENLHNCRGTGLMENGLPPSDTTSPRAEERLHREIDLLRRQLLEKNRIIEGLERDLELLHSTDQRETASLECALQEVENNLKQTAKRALNAEDMVLKLRQENKLLKSEISSLRCENVELRLGGSYDSQMSSADDVKNQKIAKELRSAASKAENSLKFLLKGVENLRALADSMENAQKFQETQKPYQKFSSEDSASGPAL